MPSAKRIIYKWKEPPGIITPNVTFSPPQSSTNVYQQSFCYRTIHDWNALPPRILDFDDIGKLTEEIQQIYKS